MRRFLGIFTLVLGLTNAAFVAHASGSTLAPSAPTHPVAKAGGALIVGGCFALGFTSVGQARNNPSCDDRFCCPSDLPKNVTTCKPSPHLTQPCKHGDSLFCKTTKPDNSTHWEPTTFEMKAWVPAVGVLGSVSLIAGLCMMIWSCE